jgi:hypothetical protein
VQRRDRVRELHDRQGEDWNDAMRSHTRRHSTLIPRR